MGNPYRTVRIPVPPEVKNYLLLNPSFKKPLRMAQNDPMGCYLIGLMMPKRSNKNSWYNFPIYKDENVIEIFLSSDKRHDYKYFLPPHRARIFRNWVKKQMYMELFARINEAIRIAAECPSFKLNIDKIIQRFEVTYMLAATEMNFLSMKKEVYRKRLCFETVDTTALENVSFKSSLNA